jgi:hypothetical protein
VPVDAARGRHAAAAGDTAARAAGARHVEPSASASAFAAFAPAEPASTASTACAAAKLQPEIRFYVPENGLFGSVL